ncbi:MAG: hypothetical protein HOV71_14830 [Hamadaea sp.]|nr:hypothetical protein [Hamadaea sp.]NUR49403.1 hypothetical protein [Hamadaea sp.]NUT08496.1 hypothetical protein [Hamadaea sp.]
MEEILMTGPPAVDSRPAIATTGLTRYLTLDGHGAPDAFPAYADALRRVAVALRLAVHPTEALWWSADGGPMRPERMHAWRWTLLQQVPLETGTADVAKASATLRGIVPEGLLSDMGVTSLDEGTVAQVLYTGSLRDKAPALRMLRDFARTHGYAVKGKYHEIYLDDPGPHSPPDARTILRLPLVRTA